MSEAMRFMVEVEGHFPREAICVRLLNHLQKHCESISRGPHAAPSTAAANGSVNGDSSGNEPMVTNGHHGNIVKNGVIASNNIQIKVCDYQPPLKNDQPHEQNNNTPTIQQPLTPTNGIIPNGYAIMTPPPHHVPGGGSVESDYDKHLDGNGAGSYKYKTNIKMRFSQDSGSTSSRDGKRQKFMDGRDRRNSGTSLENQSSTHSSPPQSEQCTQISGTSDSDNTSQNASSEMSSSLTNSNSNLKLELPRSDVIQRFSPHIKGPIQPDIKQNFNVPIFVLHSKGSYYVPLTIDYKTLLPFLQNYDIMDVMPTMHNVVLHPVTINVNFLPGFNSDTNNKYNGEYNNNWQ